MILKFLLKLIGGLIALHKHYSSLDYLTSDGVGRRSYRTFKNRRMRSQCVFDLEGSYSVTGAFDDVIISASPEFFLKPACNMLGIRHLIASPVDAKTGKHRGENCHGKEKVRRFRALFPDASVEEFYSDSYSDTPMAELAEKAYLVKGDTITDWK